MENAVRISQIKSYNFDIHISSVIFDQVYHRGVEILY